MFRNILLYIAIITVICAATVAASNNYRANSLQIISSSEIISDIEEGKDIRYDHVKIIGDLDFGTIKMNQLKKSDEYLYIYSSIKINNSEVDGIVSIPNAIFSKDIYFMRTTFTNRVEVKNSKFEKKFVFAENQLEKAALFDNDVFENDTYFLKSSFYEQVSFENTKFHKMTYFNGANFEKYANFRGANFSDYADFKNVEFKKAANFRKANFMNRVEFNNAIFHGQAQFPKSVFGKTAKFTEASFKGNAQFGGAQFLQDVIFAEVTFDKMVYFNANPSLKLNGSEFYGDLILKDSSIHIIHLEKAKFKKRISLNNSDFNKLVVEWSLIKGPIYYNGQVFQELIRNFKTQERFIDADKCYYDYRYASIDGWLDYLSLISCGFGVRPQYTLALSTFLILIFGFIFGLSNGVKKITPNCSKALSRGKSKKIRNLFKDLGEGLSFSFLVFTFQTRGGWSATGVCQLCAILEGIFGLLLFALFTVTLANIMIRY